MVGHQISDGGVFEFELVGCYLGVSFVCGGCDVGFVLVVGVDSADLETDVFTHLLK